MLAGRRHTAVVVGRVVTDFKCRLCGHQALAAVYSEGAGEDTAVTFVDDAAAKQLAHGRASLELMRNARLVASMARCPACRNVDAAALAAARNWALAKAAVIVGAPTALAWLYRFGEGAPLALVITVAGLALGFAVFSFLGDRWRWAEADARVEFLTDAELAALEAGAPTAS
jgi:hypothetical protein